MNLKKFILSIIILAVLGAVIVFNVPSISAAFSYVIGVILSAVVFYLFCATPSQPSKEQASTKTLYVGNLPYKANETSVRELFSEYGEVFAVRLMKDKRTGKRRGFGFVVMAAKDAESTITALNDQDYMQRTLKVRIANDPKHGESEVS